MMAGYIYILPCVYEYDRVCEYMNRFQCVYAPSRQVINKAKRHQHNNCAKPRNQHRHRHIHTRGQVEHTREERKKSRPMAKSLQQRHQKKQHLSHNINIHPTIRYTQHPTRHTPLRIRHIDTSRGFPFLWLAFS